ncbi:protease inhibitor I42 family protein [Nocardia crassostreae]|uniref:protease inhibitor I42 family protein n=1 Tax=Nocardia crassostreae TaxID=53428 RepID=UPI00083076DB|nr:protease inhibitor I42 family protein [Nocardia crassostreae]
MRITAAVGRTVDLELRSAPVTGYRWRPGDIPDGVEIVDAGFTPEPGGQPGDGGTQHFLIRATAPGPYAVEFRLARAWNGDAADTRTIEIITT